MIGCSLLNVHGRKSKGYSEGFYKSNRELQRPIAGAIVDAVHYMCYNQNNVINTIETASGMAFTAQERLSHEPAKKCITKLQKGIRQTSHRCDHKGYDNDDQQLQQMLQTRQTTSCPNSYHKGYYKFQNFITSAITSLQRPAQKQMERKLSQQTITMLQ